MAKVKISELPSLTPATLDTTYVVGISGSTTYKISINQLTSSLDTTFATDLVTAALSSSLDGKLSTSSYSTDSASFNSRIISGSAAEGTISGSSQISDLGFVTGSYTTINSFNSLTQSFNSISQSFSVISGSVGTIDFSTLATTGSNTFQGNQIVSGSVGISANTGSWNFKTDGTLVLPNGTGIYGNGLLKVDVVGGFLLTSYTDEFGSGSQGWYFHSDGILNVPGNIEGAPNLVTTSSFNSYTASQSTSSLVNRLNAIESVSGSWITESETGSFLTSLNGAISSSAQVLNGSGIFSSSAQLPSGLISSSTQLPSNLISGSSQISTLGYATTGSNVFSGSQTITGSLNIVPTPPSIGDSLEGGKVAYILQSGDTGYDPNLIKGIIAATSDQSTIIPWYNGVYITTSATGTAIGTGLSNTNTIITSQGATSTDYAAGLARAYGGGGYSDWYLPSKDELNQLYINRVAIGGFTDNYYWSSTEVDSNLAWYQFFDNGSQSSFNKFTTFYVRAIRTFSIQKTVLTVVGDTLLTGSLNISGSAIITGSVSATSFNGTINATNGVISGSSQLTSSFDTRYAISASFVSSSNVLSMRTITSASYAALTPVSGTLYIIIG